MSTLFKYRFTIRHHLIALIGLCLCLYFGYHIIHGERSVSKLIVLSQNIETLSHKSDVLRDERESLEQRVAMMRPGSINKDLLEEQVRATLGYRHANERVIIRN